MLLFLEFPFKVGQDFLVIFIIILDFSFSWHFVKFFKVILIELNLYLIDDEFAFDLCVCVLQHTVLFVLNLETVLKFGLIACKIPVLLAEVSDDEFEAVELTGCVYGLR
jgi:hypothetical protein